MIMASNQKALDSRGVHRPVRLIVGLAAVAALGSIGCTSDWGRGEVRRPETVIEVDRANFKTTVVHAVGQATRHYIFWIPVSGPSDVSSTAWRRMKRNAGIDGKPAQFVNVTEQPTEQGVVWPIYYQKVHTVSADAITFDPKSHAGKTGPRRPKRE